jgi:hypothetical protein
MPLGFAFNSREKLRPGFHPELYLVSRLQTLVLANTAGGATGQKRFCLVLNPHWWLVLVP